MSNKAFSYPEYSRKVNVLRDLTVQQSLLLSKETGMEYEKIYPWVENKVKEKLKRPNVPTVKVNARDMVSGDKEPVVMPVTNYIYKLFNSDNIVTPSMTSYIPASVKVSKVSHLIGKNAEERGIVKKQSHAEEAKGNIAKAQQLNQDQTNYKLSNNAASGCFSTRGSVLYNPSAHSSLTSTTRIVTSVANVTNEKLIAGNRHYFSVKVIIGNLLSIIQSLQDNTIYGCTLGEKLTEVQHKYNLHVPTVEEVMDMITYSSKLYILDRCLLDVRSLVVKLSDLERMAIMYIGDLYHLRKYNDTLMRNFMGNIATKHNTKTKDNFKVIKDADENVVLLSHAICLYDIAGMGLDYQRMEKENVLDNVASTVENIESVVSEYEELINCLLCTRNIPGTVVHVQDMVRRVVLVSDTDSTCCSSDEWVIWYNNGELKFDEKSYGVASSVMYLAFETIGHYLVMVSANIGVAKEKLRKIAMKNEYMWSSLALTFNNSKHYYADTIIKEGNVYPPDKSKLEIKGVHFKNSALAPEVTDFAQRLMTETLATIKANGKVSITDLITNIADMEREIVEHIKEGGTKYYKKSTIKSPDGYKQPPELSAYRNHIFWNEIFGSKYGIMPEPEYMVAQVPSSLRNKTGTKYWISTMEDKEIANKLGNYLDKRKKSHIPNFYIPVDKIQEHGLLPDEIFSIVDTKKLILIILNICYLILESFGYVKKDDYTLIELGY